MFDFYFLVGGYVLLFHVFLRFLRSSECDVIDNSKCTVTLEVVEYFELFKERWRNLANLETAFISELIIRKCW